jgi:inosine/xanthosine triphosphatase
MVKIKICVGSLNPTKVNAVKIAFEKYFTEFEIFKIKANSGVPNQPIGMDLILKGAKNRAEHALSFLNNEKQVITNNLGIGIEAGLVKIPFAKTDYMDFQFCVIIDEHQQITIGSGIAFEYPQAVINEILSNPETEIGDVIGGLADNMNLKNEAGAINFLSKKQINRTEILTQAVICALLPRINRELYGF